MGGRGGGRGAASVSSGGRGSVPSRRLSVSGGMASPQPQQPQPPQSSDQRGPHSTAATATATATGAGAGAGAGVGVVVRAEMSSSDSAEHVVTETESDLYALWSLDEILTISVLDLAEEIATQTLAALTLSITVRVPNAYLYHVLLCACPDFSRSISPAVRLGLGLILNFEF